MLNIGLASQPTTESEIFGSHQCMEFDGNSDYFDFPAGLMALINPNAGTISCWVDIRDNDGGTSQNLVRLAHDSSNDNISLQFHRGNTEFRAVYKIGGTYKEATYNDASLDVAGYAAQGWVHLTMTFESDGAGDGEVKMYFNGTHSETVAQTSNWNGSNSIDIARVGTNDDANGGFIDGFIDQVAIYNVVKSSTEISAMYNGGVMRDLSTIHGRGPAYTPNGLIGYYQFEGNANDSSGNNFTGTLVGTAGYSSSQP
jgi:hypothetical protein